MQRHAEEGARIIDRLGFLNDAVPAIRHHHERFDGTGYPDGLAGEDIPLGARIIHVADALDSMLTTRIYRAARPSRRRSKSSGAAPEPSSAPSASGRSSDSFTRGTLGASVFRPPLLADASVEQPRSRGPRHPLTRALSSGEANSRRACPRAHRTGRARSSLGGARGVLGRAAPSLFGRGDPGASSRPAQRGSRRSPTMRDLAGDAAARVHPQTAVERFGSWNAAKRRAGLPARRFVDSARSWASFERSARNWAGVRRAATSSRPAWKRALEVARLAHLRLAFGRVA